MAGSSIFIPLCVGVTWRFSGSTQVVSVSTPSCGTDTPAAGSTSDMAIFRLAKSGLATALRVERIWRKRRPSRVEQRGRGWWWVGR